MSSMQNNPVTRSTTATRRVARFASMRGHVSKWPVERPATINEAGVMTPAGIDWFFKTYNVGRNKFKSMCCSLGLSRKKVERDMRAQHGAV